ncbi:MAG TPA: outer membrane lipoprotein carrier protein LolA [Pseudobdellovibrionaceae bacterium]|nr:outer membrane lipoprotein carrier protein LolA [Pseudobdellovibrionaceae bacterium]
MRCLLVLMCVVGSAFLGLGRESQNAFASTSVPRNPTDMELKTLSSLSARYAQAGQIQAQVLRRTKLGLLGQTRVAEGQLTLSKGRIRMELKSSKGEKLLLIVGPKTYWSVTDPGKKDAALQVVTGALASKAKGAKGGASRPVLLEIFGAEGFLRSFAVTGVLLAETQGVRYYLQPKADWVDARRAMIRVIPEGAQWALAELQLWDAQDNETTYELSNVKVLKVEPKASLFQYSIPKNADVLSVGER